MHHDDHVRPEQDSGVGQRALARIYAVDDSEIWMQFRFLVEQADEVNNGGEVHGPEVISKRVILQSIWTEGSKGTRQAVIRDTLSNVDPVCNDCLEDDCIVIAVWHGRTVTFDGTYMHKECNYCNTPKRTKKFSGQICLHHSVTLSANCIGFSQI